MSDTPMGNGWWQASDGKWYPPEQQPATEQSPTVTGWSGDDPTAVQPAASVQPDPGPVTPGPGPVGAVPGAPAAAAGGTTRTKRGKGRLIAAIAVVLVLVAGGFVVLAVLSDDKAGAEVLAEKLGETGPHPYTASVAPEPSATLADFAAEGFDTLATGDDGAAGGYRAAAGTVPGLYGGSLDEEACDVPQMKAFLEAEEDKAAAWARVLDIAPEDIPAYLDLLTPVNLGSDTRVLNHGYDDGQAVPRQSVLQRGTAALVDRKGVPRVNCYSGNPLTEPTVEDGEEFTGSTWSGLDRTTVIVIAAAPAEVDVFQIVDVASGELFARPAGSGSGGNGGIGDATGSLVDDGPIDFDTTYDDTLEGERIEARYTLDAPDGAIMTLTVANDRSSTSGVYASFASGGDRYAAFRVQPGGEEEAVVILGHDDGASFELVFSEGPGSYTFTVALEIQSDAGEDGDAGDDFASAFEVAAGAEVSGLLGDQDTTDHYTVEIEPRTELTFNASVDRASTRAAYFTLQISGENLLRERVQPGADIAFSLLLGEEDEGALDIIVTEGGATYTFTAAFVTNDEGDGPGDAPSTLAEARTVSVGTSVNGEVGNRDVGDYYVFEAPSGSLQVTAVAENSNEQAYGLTLEDANGSRIDFFRVAPGAAVSKDYEVEAGTTLRLIVTEGRGEYSITLG